MPTRPRASVRQGLIAISLVALTLGLAVPSVLAATRGVEIRDFAFAPRTIEIRVGDTVRWTNRDTVGHTATAQNGSFDTGLMAEGESGSIRFTVAGTYRYVCTPHPNMTGTVVVRLATTVVPPNTETVEAAGSGAGEATTTGARLGLLAVFGGVAFLLIERLLRRRRASP